MSSYGQSDDVIGLFRSSKITRDESVGDGNAGSGGIVPRGKLRINETRVGPAPPTSRMPVFSVE